jgi:myo-inositol-1(or 4)-monophosphatase
MAMRQTSRRPAKVGAAARKPHGMRRGGDLSRELAVAKDAARMAGQILRRFYKRGGYHIGSKGRDNPVTEADLQADRALREMLGGAFPDYGWLSEETADDRVRLRRSRAWIVDPLDGTKEFIKGIPEFCVAIGLVEDGVPILGVSYNPIRREMFWGVRGAGCHLNSRRVHVTRTRALRRATVLASRSETARGEWQVFHGKLIVSPTGSVAYKLAMVAAGKGDATFTRSPKNEWDIASGAALILAAGGAISDIRGREIRFNQRHVTLEGLIADNGLIHDALVRVVKETAAKK